MAQNLLLGRDSNGVNRILQTHTDGKLLLDTSTDLNVNINSGGFNGAVTNAALTELGNAINASNQLDVNIANNGFDGAVTNAALTELGNAINASNQLEVKLVANSLASLPVSSSASKSATTVVNGAAFTAEGEYGDSTNAVDVSGKRSVLICGHTNEASIGNCPEIHLVGYSASGAQSDANRLGFSSITAHAQSSPDSGDAKFYYNQVFENVGWSYVRAYTDTASQAGKVATIQVIGF